MTAAKHGLHVDEVSLLPKALLQRADERVHEVAHWLREKLVEFVILLLPVRFQLETAQPADVLGRGREHLHRIVQRRRAMLAVRLLLRLLVLVNAL